MSYGKPVKIVRLFQGRIRLRIYNGVGDHAELALLAPAEVMIAGKAYARLGLDVEFCEACNGYHMRGLTGDAASLTEFDDNKASATTAGHTQKRNNPLRL